MIEIDRKRERDGKEIPLDLILHARKYNIYYILLYVGAEGLGHKSKQLKRTNKRSDHSRRRFYYVLENCAALRISTSDIFNKCTAFIV